MALSATQRVGKEESTGATSVTVASGDGWSTPTSGRVLVAVHMATVAETTMTVPSGFTKRVGVDRGGFASIQISTKIADGTETSITATTSASNIQSLVVWELSGADTTTAHGVDQTGSTTWASAATSQAVSTAGATSQAVELAIAAFCLPNSGGGFSSWSNSFNERFDAPTAQRHGAADKDLTATGTISTTATWGTARQGAAAIITIKAAPQTVTVGLASTTETAQPVSGGKTRTAGQPATVETALSVGGAKARTLGLVSETDTALPLTGVKTGALGLASTGETALAITAVKSAALGLASDLHTAQGLTGVKVRAVGLASDVHTALPAGGGKTRTLGLATTTGTARPVAASKALTLGLASETDTALPLAVAASGSVAERVTVARPDVSVTAREPDGTVATAGPPAPAGRRPASTATSTRPPTSAAVRRRAT